MTLSELKNKCLSLIAKNDFEEVLDFLCKNLNPERKAFSTLLSLSSRYNRVLEDEMTGVISFDNATLEKNKVAAGLVKLINDLKSEDLGQGGSLTDPLDELAAQLPVDFPLTPLFLVNCDRRDPVRTFWKQFKDYQEHNRRFQFYFLPSCPTQEPDGFAERTVYELLEKIADNERQAIDFQENADNRLIIEPLPFSDSGAEASIKEFRKYFAQRFGLANSEEDFYHYVQTGLPKLAFNYVATAFKVTADEWDQENMGPYFEWLISTFRDTGPNIPTFLFYIVVIVKNAHAPEKLRRDVREALDGAQEIVKSHPEQATCIEPLPPVHADYLEDWIEKLGNAGSGLKNRIKEEIAGRLDEEELQHYRKTEELNMEPIADFQRRVYNHHKNG